MKTDAGYIQFPLCLLRDLLVDKEDTINKILDYGIVRYAHKINYELLKVAQQIIYDLYRGKLGNSLQSAVDQLNTNIIGTDEYYKGFSINGEFEPTEEEVEEIMRGFDNISGFKEGAIEHYQVHLAKESLHIKGNSEETIKIYHQIENSISSGEPFPMVSVKNLFEFRDSDKSEFELAQFAAYIAVRSILGKKKYCKTNKDLIRARMFGYPRIKDLPEQIPPPLDGLWEKYSTRYHMDKLLEQLELSWYIKKYSHYTRGMFISANEDVSYETLAEVTETSKRKSKVEKLKKEKAEARRKVLENLGGKPEEY